MGVGAVGVDADFVHVGLAGQQRAGCAQSGGHGGIGFGWCGAEEGGADRGGVGQHVDLVFERQGYAVQQAQRMPFSEALGGGARLSQQIGRVAGGEGTQRRRALLAGLERGSKCFGHAERRERAAAVGAREVHDGVVGHIRRAFAGLKRLGGGKVAGGLYQRGKGGRFIQRQGVQFADATAGHHIADQRGADARSFRGGGIGFERGAGQLGQF